MRDALEVRQVCQQGYDVLRQDKIVSAGGFIGEFDIVRIIKCR
jgi:hypothetical protein